MSRDTPPLPPDQPPDQPPDDGQLVAYLDGELEPAARARVEAALADAGVARRLAVLASGAIPADAFAPLLDAAPVAGLEAMLDALPGGIGGTGDRPRAVTGKPASSEAGSGAVGRMVGRMVGVPRLAPSRPPAGWTRRGAIAAGLALLAGGALTDRLTDRLAGRLGRTDEEEREDGQEDERAEAPDHWRAAVAQYLALYTPETLADLPDDPAAQARQLRRVAGSLGLDLAPARLAVAGAALKSARLLSYDGAPLGQITYLDMASGPMALCLMRSPGGAAPIATERRLGMSVAYWSDGARVLMLIGRRSPTAMRNTAETLQASLA